MKTTKSPQQILSTLYEKWRRRPLSNPRNLRFEVNGEFGASDDFCRSNSEYLRQAGCRRREREEQRFRLDEFMGLGEASIPGFQIALEAFHRTGNWEQTATTLRVGRRRCDSPRWRVRELGKGVNMIPTLCDACLVPPVPRQNSIRANSVVFSMI